MSGCLLPEKGPSSLPDSFLCFLIVEAFQGWFTPAELPDHKYYIFGREGAKQLAEQRGLRLLGEIPVVQSICDGGDAGKPVALNADSITGTAFRQLADEVVKAVEENHDPAKRVRVTRQ